MVGLVLAPIFMGPGTPLVPLSDRLEYLTRHQIAWSIAWGVWALCALALVAFLFYASEALPRPRGVARLALLLAAAGLAVDLTCDAIFIAVLPRIAARAPVPTELFLAIERIANAGGQVVANGLYSIAVLILTLRLGSVDRVPRLATWTGFGTFGSGMTMVAGGILDRATLLEASTGPTIGLFVIWTIVVGRRLARP